MARQGPLLLCIPSAVSDNARQSFCRETAADVLCQSAFLKALGHKMLSPVVTMLARRDAPSWWACPGEINLRAHTPHVPNVLETGSETLVPQHGTVHTGHVASSGSCG